ncbi:unnamed protein product [Moneuplotes crassus]|uniref:Uncharacterized protein n=2 Tax=Euplotes crassus TaxID=5936 RepID=A0AAD1XGX4_EUPCR|nr:unnamed protein product [Moneuplotes crassus]
MSKENFENVDLENNKAADEPQPVKESCWNRFTSWYWGPNIKEYINPDERPVMNFKALMAFRIFLTVLLLINLFYRLGYTANDGASTFFRYQLYFTSWSLYITIYTEIWIICVSFKNNKNGVDLEDKTQVNLLKHNHIFMILTLAMESVTTLMYWIAIYEYDSKFSVREVSGMLDHILPLIVILFEFFSNGWVLYQRQTVVIFTLFTYFPVNISYSIFGPRDLYEMLPWDTVMSYVFVLVIFGIAFGGHAIYALYSQCRYNKGKKENKDKKVSQEPSSEMEKSS